MSMSLEEIVRQEARVLGYERLKPQQVRAVEAFVGGRKDVFVSLPTGYGKSLCFGLLPRVFDHIRGVKERSITIVISPLVSLIQDQCSTFNKMGLSAAYVGSCDNDVRRRMKEGEYQLLFACPEVFSRSFEVRSMLSSQIYIENLVALVVDEAHCIKKW